MCGIVGIVRRDARISPDCALLERMTASLDHRGPDDGGVYIKGAVGLGHRRLSVIDLSGGRQPMVNKETERALVYNGEIYNFRELRRTLETGSDVSFETDCDTEVLLHMASISKFEWIETLNGMFAFALWDENAQTLLLGRDRLGIKPLYYTHLDNEFLFASEVRALLVHPKVAAMVNVERIPEYLAFRSICGTETMFKGIYEVPPGHVMLFRQKTFEGTLIKGWSEGKGKNIHDYVDPTISFEDQFQRLLLDSVRFRLISDVPLGTYNSGGVDSSLVTAMVRSLTEGELHTFSVGFEEADYDESEYAEVIAKRLGTHHHTLMINEHEYLQSYEQAVSSLEEPLNHAHTVPLLQLSKFAKQFVTVVLTGEGADELFAGYPRFHIPILAQSLRVLPRIFTDLGLEMARLIGSRKVVKLLENAQDGVRAIVENSRFTPGRDFGAVCPGLHPFTERMLVYGLAEGHASSVLERMLYFDQRTYLPALLNRLDKVSMAAAIECRVPYLDYRLIEWSALIPAALKIRVGWDNKVIVKQVASRWVPQEIVSRKKVGFGVPVSRWLRNVRGLGRYLDLLTDNTFRARGYCDPKVVERLIYEHLQEGSDHGEILWGLINLEIWWRLYIDSTAWQRNVTMRQVQQPPIVPSAASL
jgi:asparagine synthase (glutamine-hydrolysing)